MQSNLYTKKELRFKNGKFRILCISDLHGIVNYDRRLTRDIGLILDATKPDLLMLLGDVADHDALDSEENLRCYLDDINEVIEKRRIPWAHTFGNHDSEEHRSFSQMSVYESYEYCISKRGPLDIHGITNYVLPVKSEKSDDIVYNVWSLDTHDSLSDMMREFSLGSPESKWDRQCAYPSCLHDWSQTYNTLNFDQIMWYGNTSAGFEKLAGHKIPGMLALHIPLPEYAVTYKNTAETYYKGTRREAVGCPPVNSGMFNAMLCRGDIKTVVSGHDHINDCEGVWMGIRLAYDAGLSYDCYCADDLRGGRIIDITEADPWNIETFMVRTADIHP